MDSTRFDTLTRALIRWRTEAVTPRRAALKLLAGGSSAMALARFAGTETAKGRKKKKRKKGLKLRALCTPGKAKCRKGLQCDSPTTRHSCSGSIPDDSNWCCVPPGGSCTECDCCGDYYCEFDDNNEPHCVPNPEN